MALHGHGAENFVNEFSVQKLVSVVYEILAEDYRSNRKCSDRSVMFSVVILNSNRTDVIKYFVKLVM